MFVLVAVIFAGCAAPQATPTPVEVARVVEKCGLPFLVGLGKGVPSNDELVVDCVFHEQAQRAFLYGRGWCSSKPGGYATSISLSFPKDWGGKDALRFLQCNFPDRNWEEGIGENWVCYGEGSVIFRGVKNRGVKN